MSYIVFLIRDKLYTGFAGVPCSYEISTGSKADLFVPEMDGTKVVIKENKRGEISLECSGRVKFRDNNVRHNALTVIDVNEHMAIYYSDTFVKDTTRIKLPYTGKITVGRSDQNNIVINNPLVGRRHFQITCENGAVYVEDLNSTNGLYLNGRRISKAQFNNAETLSIVHINIRLLNNELVFENISIASSSVEDKGPDRSTGGAENTGSGRLLYKRSPRIQSKLPTEAITLAPPPSAASKYEKRKGGLASLFGSGVMMASSMVATTISPAMLAARAASLVSPLIGMASQSGDDKSRRTKIEEYNQMRYEKYGEYIQSQRAIIDTVAKTQREILTRENPTAIECVERLRKLDITLWERGPRDRDFMDIRLGMGYEKLCVDVKSRPDSGFKMETDEQEELVKSIVEETRYVDNVPTRLSFLEYQTVGIVGQRSKTIGMVRNMITALTTSHCFTEVNIIGIFDESEREVWNAIRWLPHVWDENKQFRFLAFDEENAANLCDMGKDLLKSRLKDGEGSYRNDSIPSPFYFFIFGSKKFTQKSELVNILTTNNVNLGASALFLYDDLYSLPHECQFILDVDNGPCGYVRTEANNKFFYTFDREVSPEQFDKYCRTMSSIELDGVNSASAIPQGVTFLKGYGVTRVEELNAWDRWNNAVPYKSLAAPIGIMGGDQPFCLDVHEKAHGPHGLVAGTTGSGKSETIISWVLSMAINFHPYDVNFVIIDYKGGGMANSLMDLPHCVGKITNIAGGIGRTLDSLKAELKRRQRVFDQYSEYEVNHIDKYQKLYHQGVAKEPLPHLIIVSDEFAELKANQPEFMAALVSAARIGRSLGVHLVLATQKPTGVVDEQINTNSRFRVCLKVASGSDSREMIRRPDAARITQSGRAYVLVGEDEVFEQFQSLYSGNVYNPNAVASQNTSNQVRIIEDSGVRRAFKKKKPEASPADGEKKKVIETTELMAIREYIVNVAKEHGIEKLNGPWTEELPENITIDELKVPGGFNGNTWEGKLPWLQIPVGKYDLPEMQTQGIQMIDFANEGHLAIYGAPSTGKTTLLKSLLFSAAKYYTPEDLNIYVIDLGGWGLNTLSGLPHVGGVALDVEAEKVLKLGQMLDQEIIRRRKVFLANGVSSLSAYREANDGGMPAIILAIDNIVPIFEQFPDMEPILVTLASQGPTYGIYMVYTSNNTTGVRYKVVQNIKGAVCFEMTDKGDYAGIVGRLDGKVLPKVSGRAFFKGASPIEFQAAMYIDGETEKAKNDKLKAEIAKMDAAWTGVRPEPIPVMPEELPFSNLFAQYRVRHEIPVGISYTTIKTAVAPMFDRYNFLVSGSMKTGKSKYIAGIADSIMKTYPESLLYVIDSTRGSLSSLRDGARIYGKCNDGETMTAMMNEIVEHLNVRKRGQNAARLEAGDSFSEEEYIAAFEPIIILVDDLKEYIDEISNDNKNSLERICKLAQGLGVLVFVAGRTADIERLNGMESLTRALVANQLGVGIGSGPAVHSFMRNDLSYKDKEVEPGEGNASFFNDGHCEKIKLPV